MNLFHPDSLSPKKKEAIACALPFGLTWEDMQDVLPGFFLQEGNQAQAFASHAKQGLHGGDNSCILTIRYPTSNNEQRSETIFFKHNEDPTKAEALKYRFLASQGVPVPRLLAARKSGDAETILLEFLSTIGIDFTSSSEVNNLLELVAKINSVLNPPDFFIGPPGMPEEQFDGLVRNAFMKLEDILVHSHANNPIDAAGGFAAYQTTQKVVASLPKALNHNEFYFQQVGWVQRGESRHLVVFDLETMSLAPRFTDIATILYPLSVYSGQAQIRLFQIYLEYLSGLIDINANVEEALRELRYTRFHSMCQSLPWLVCQVQNAEDVEKNEGLTMTLGALKDDMLNLGLSAEEPIE